MKTKLNCVMLIDDDAATNFLHEQIISVSGFSDVVITSSNGKEALEYLKNPDPTKCECPDIIFLDLNMPTMNGWEFLEKYKQLNQLARDRTKVVILSNSNNPNDLQRALAIDDVKAFKNKPLDFSILESIRGEYF